MAVVAPAAAQAGGVGGDGGSGGQHAGLTVSLFGSGKSHIEALEEALKGTAKQQTGGRKAAASGSGGGGGKAKKGGKGKRRKKRGDGGQQPQQAATASGSTATGQPNAQAPQAQGQAASTGAGAGAGAGASTGAGAGAGAGASAGATAGGAGAGAGVAPQAGVGASAGAGAGVGAGTGAGAGAGGQAVAVAAAASRPVKAIEHVPTPTDVGQASEMIMGFGDALRHELSRGLPTLEGYLIKLGGASLGLRVLKRWTRRYFVLTGPVLRYWETKSDRDALGLGGVRAAYELDGAKVDSVRVPDAPFPYAVELVTSSGLREYLVAEKQEHVDLWTKALRGVVDTLAAFPALHLSVAGKPRGSVTVPPQPAVPLDIGLGMGMGGGGGGGAPGTPGTPVAVRGHSGSVSTPGNTRQASVRGDGSLVLSPGAASDTGDSRGATAAHMATGSGRGGAVPSTSDGAQYPASVVSDVSYISSPGVHTVAVAVPVAVERPPVGAATSTAGAGTGGGAGVVGSAAAGPAGAVPVSVAEEHVCTKCHNALEDGDVFCDNCGTRVT